MVRIVSTLALAALTCVAQDSQFTRPPLVLTFEPTQTGGAPGGWGGGPPGTIFADDKIVHGGRWSARIERNPQSTSGFSSLTRMIPVDFKGETIELRGFIRTENVSEFAGLWMREDGENGILAFDNMQSRKLSGTTDWAEYSIVLPLREGAREVYFGFLVGGTGKAWVDEIRLLVDAKPASAAPPIDRPKTSLDLDHEFDSGSRLTFTQLSSAQIDNLVTLGKVWGFLKYHHPQVTSGKRHWDYDLFRVLPSVLAASTRAAANAAILKWIDGLGDVAPCNPCASLNTDDLHLSPKLDWISNEPLLGKELSGRLLSVHKNRSIGKQFYVSLTPHVANATFDHELAYL